MIYVYKQGHILSMYCTKCVVERNYLYFIQIVYVAMFVV